jgi:hypothetical protein
MTDQNELRGKIRNLLVAYASAQINIDTTEAEVLALIKTARIRTLDEVKNRLVHHCMWLGCRGISGDSSDIVNGSIKLVIAGLEEKL